MFQLDWIDAVRGQSEAWDRPVLSVYLNVDPSQETNLNKGYLRRYKAAIRDAESKLGLERDSLARFRAAAESVEAVLADYQPDGKAIAMFQAPGGRFWKRSLQVPVRETVDWADNPAFEPLVEILDEHERYGVALFDRSSARIFVAHLGEIEEIADFVAQGVSQIKTTGTDHRWSEANFQRRADQHFKTHARDTANALVQADRTQGFDRILLAGRAEACQALRQELPTRLRRKVVEAVAMNTRATAQEVLAKVQEIHSVVERAEEVAVVERLMSALASDEAAAGGLEATARAVAEGRVHELVIAGDFQANWGDLAELPPQLPAPSDEASEDLRQCLVRRTLEAGGRVEFVWGTAAERMNKESGGIGAFLRYA